MDIGRHYDKMWQQSLAKFKRQEFEFDPLIDSEKDSRYGLTLIAKPAADIKRKIVETLEEIRAVAPRQYFYPPSDLHVTVLTIISCYPDFTLDEIDSSEYINLIQSALESVFPFHIEFKGLTASPSCILIRGYPEDDQLNTLRTNLRKIFRQSSLKTSLDERYIRQTAHMTAIRFTKPLTDEHTFIQTLINLKEKAYGSSLVDKLELVGTDWYHQKKKTNQIYTFDLEK